VSNEKVKLCRMKKWNCVEWKNEIVSNEKMKLCRMEKWNCVEWKNEIVSNEKMKLCRMKKWNCVEWKNEIVSNEKWNCIAWKSEIVLIKIVELHYLFIRESFTSVQKLSTCEALKKAKELKERRPLTLCMCPCFAIASHGTYSIR